MCVYVCVGGVNVCAQQIALRSSSDIPPDSSELFTVPGLSGREGGEARRGRGKQRQKTGSDREQRSCAGFCVLAQQGFCLSSHHHLVMC